VRSSNLKTSFSALPCPSLRKRRLDRLPWPVKLPLNRVQSGGKTERVSFCHLQLSKARPKRLLRWGVATQSRVRKGKYGPRLVHQPANSLQKLLSRIACMKSPAKASCENGQICTARIQRDYGIRSRKLQTRFSFIPPRPDGPTSTNNSYPNI